MHNHSDIIGCPSYGLKRGESKRADGGLWGVHGRVERVLIGKGSCSLEVFHMAAPYEMPNSLLLAWLRNYRAGREMRSEKEVRATVVQNRR